MTPLRVVLGLDLAEDRALRVLSCLPIALHQQLALERREEALRHRVVVTVAFATHAGNHPVRGQVDMSPA